MSDERIALMLEVLNRSDRSVNRAALEDDLYQALKDGLSPNTRQAIVDALALFSQAKRLASRKGTKRKKGEEVLHLLNLTNAKSRHLEGRDGMLRTVIASEMRRRDNQKLTSSLRDEMANLIATDPTEISKTWRAGKAKALAHVTQPLPEMMVQDIKIALGKLSGELGKTRGN